MSFSCALCGGPRAKKSIHCSLRCAARARKQLTITERLDKHSEIRSSGCIEWNGYTDPNGYGRIGIKGRVKLVHRVAWALKISKIPEGVCVLHRCDNPPCFNVSHLFLGTRADNNRDMRNKGRQKSNKGEKNGASKLTEKEIKRIRKLYGDKNHSHRSLAKKFRTARSNIGRILTRKSWRHLA